MKKIRFYLLENDPNIKDIVNYQNRFQNALIIFKDGKYYFKSHYESDVEIIDYSHAIFKISKEIEEHLVEIIKLAFKEAKEISEENMNEEKNNGDLIKALMSILNRYYYDSHSNADIFDLVTDMFIRILMGHYLINGNKRLALTFLKGILWEFGYYLKWTRGHMWKNYSKHKTQIEEFVQELENQKEKENKIKIKNWILKNVIIGLNWR